MANFLGFKQVTLAWFEANSATTDLKQYMWLVRDEENVNTSIYFGSRKYAEINNDAKAQQALDTLSSLIESIGGIVDENGEYVGFLPVTGSTVLNAATTIAEALQALDEAIAANDEAIKANAEAIADNAEAIEDINDLIGEVPSGMTVVEYMLEELNKVVVAANKLNDVLVNGESVVNPETGKAEIVLTDYATKEEVNSAVTIINNTIEDLDKKVDDEVEALDKKIDEVLADANSGLTELEKAVADLDKKVDDAVEEINDEIDDLKDAVSSLTETKADKADLEALEAKVAGVWHFKGMVDTMEDLPADAENGDVYQVGEKEYAFNGAEWVELGFNLDLSEYATKEYVDSAITVVEKEIADVEKEVEDVAKDVETLQGEVEDLQKEMELTESALTKEIQERIEAVEDLQAADAEHDRLISGLTETVQELLSDNAHIITGNDVEE